jgi:hypothetical protein
MRAKTSTCMLALLVTLGATSASYASIRAECESTRFHSQYVCPAIKIMRAEFASFKPPAPNVVEEQVNLPGTDLNYKAGSTTQDESKQGDGGSIFLAP